jgi:hypothetical protein
VARHPLVDLRRVQPRNVGQPGREAGGIALASGHHVREALQLGNQHRAVPLRHPQVAAQDFVLVPAALRQPADIVQRPREIVELAGVGDHDPALAGIDVLAGLEAEAAEVADRANRRPLPRRTPRLAGILQYRDPMLSGNLEHAVHVGRLPADVDRDDRLRPRRDRGLDPGGIDVVRFRIDVDEDRPCPNRER